MDYKQLPLFPAEEMDKLIKLAEDQAWETFLKSTKGATCLLDKHGNTSQPGKKKPRKKRSNEK